MNMDKLMGLLGKKDKLQFKESFKPIMPKKWVNDYNTWLRTDDIEKCLDQHDKSDNHFYFYGAVPIDFNKCSVSDLCSFNLKKHISNGIRKIGIVFNTDPHNEPGEHWISAYIDIYGDNLNKIPGLYYYDSYGEGPPKEVKDLFQKIKKQGINLNKKFKVNDLVIFESTVYPGVTENFCKKIIEKKSNLSFNKDFFCGYSPERIKI